MIREGIRDVAGRERREYATSVSEENPFKQPLLVKSRADSFDSTRGFCHTPSKRSNSRREMALALAAERECDDAAEAMGQGMYSLHAVIGQGSFGRIHLASWRREDTEGLDGGPEAEIRGGGHFRDEAAAAPSSEGGYREVSLSTVAAGIREALGAGGVGDALGARTRAFWWRRRQRGFDSPGALSISCHGFANTREEECDGAGGDGVEVGGPGQPRLRALKSICKRKVTEKGLARHIQTELAVLRQCSHPFIVSLSPVGGGQFQTSGHLHLVLEYCPGGDLFSVLRREGRLMETQARVCAAQVALALRHLHHRHIAYRDLKPENICIDARGRAILVDFSLARIGLDRAPGGKATTFCGSAAYAAPEMIAREGHDTRVDLWSLGCVIYEILVGEHPFRRSRDRSDRQALFDRILRGRPDYPSHLSRWAVSLLKGLLTVDPNRRLSFSSSPPLDAASIPTGDRREPKEGVETHVSSGWSPTEPLARTAVTPSGRDDSGKSVRLLSAGIIADADRGGGVDANNEPDEERSADRYTEGDADGVGVVTRDGCHNKERSQSGDRLAARESVTPSRAEVTGDGRRSSVGSTASPRVLSLLEHGFFRGMPGWGGPGTGGAWDETKLEGLAVVVPSLRDTFDVHHFDSRFTSQPVGLELQGHPHKGGPTPPFEEFDWRPDGCIELAQVEDRRHSGFLGSVAAAFWC